MSLQKIFKSGAVRLIGIICLLIPQIAHTAFLYNTYSHYDRPWFAWLFASGLDISILVFVAAGKKKQSIAYALAVITLNIIYLFAPEHATGKVLIAVLLGITLYFFSELFYEEGKRLTANEAQNDSGIPQNTSGQPQIISGMLSGSIDALEVQYLVTPFICPECEKSFLSSRELNGHISGHKQKDDWHPLEHAEYWETENEHRNNKRIELITLLNKHDNNGRPRSNGTEKILQN